MKMLKEASYMKALLFRHSDHDADGVIYTRDCLKKMALSQPEKLELDLHGNLWVKISEEDMNFIQEQIK